jgi:hypothetical protein
MCVVTLRLSKCVGKPAQIFRQAQYDSPQITLPMKKYFSLLFFITISFIASLSAQTDTVINGKRYKIVEDTKIVNGIKEHVIPLDSTFLIKNKKFKYYNNWLTLGGGWQQNLTYKRNLGFTGGLDYNFHIKQRYFQLGTNISGLHFGFYNNYQFHLGYGFRFEDKVIHYAAFGGISYSTGYGKVDSVYTRKFSQPGIYVQGEMIKKVAYDVGLGGSVFADWNQEQIIVGFRLILYFSGAYKGKQSNDPYSQD